MNPIRDRLKAGKTIVGTSGSIFEDNMVMLADSGLDFILFDTQHSPNEPKQYKGSYDAIKGKDISHLINKLVDEKTLDKLHKGTSLRGEIIISKKFS